MKTLNYIFLLTFLILSVNVVSAVPPITTEFVGNTGLNIQANILDYYKINTSAELHIYIFNISNGVLLTNTSVNCEVELTDKTGTVLLLGNPVPHQNYFKMMRNESIVTEVGTYGVTIVCNSSGIGGLKTKFFEATTTGNAPPESIIILGFIIIMLFIFIFMIVFLIKAIGLIIEANFDFLDIAYAWGSYFGLLGVKLFAEIYLGNIIINNFLDVLVTILAFPMILFPIIAFFLSIFRQKKEQKKESERW